MAFSPATRNAVWVLAVAFLCMRASGMQQGRLVRSEMKHGRTPRSHSAPASISISDKASMDFGMTSKSKESQGKGFDWGSGCAGGSGSFTASLAEGQVTLVGDIPKGKADISIQLEALKDADVQLFDMEDVEECNGEGLPLIAYSEGKGKCAQGELGNNDGTTESMYHKGMTIQYSGYYGQGPGKEGFEFIRITGEVTAALKMKAFGFEGTNATISYSWGRTPTPCCMGTEPCGGSFTTNIKEGEVMDIGEIPAGKLDLQVSLEAADDIDIQLYDLDDTECPGGRAIVAYSAGSESCGTGNLGNNDGTTEKVQYKNRTYGYSGYYGIGEGGDSDFHGKEWIKIGGVLNRKLSMKAYGYAAGRAIVKYWYYENYTDPSQPEVLKLSPVSLWSASQLHTTAKYKSLPGITVIVRRGGPEFEVTALNANDVSCSIGTEMQQWVTFVGCKVTVAWDSPIGNYTMQVTSASDGVSTKASLIILFNPYKYYDETYVSKKVDREEYLERSSGLIWQGLSDDYTANAWEFEQYDPLSLDMALWLTRRMPVKDRASAVLVARHLSYSINEDVCYGRWGGGSYTSGRPFGGYRCSKKTPCFEPGHWTGTLPLLKHFDKALKREYNVQYCQCFVYAGVFTTIGRALGIASRPVTTFQSAHDTNNNRAIDKFYRMLPDGVLKPTDEFVPSTMHDSVWSFHVWTELYFKREGSGANGWQAVDSTPQELSAGGNSAVGDDPIYQLGPASVRQVKANKHDFIESVCNDTKYGCFDAEFVISEVNSNVNVWYLEEDVYTQAQADGTTPTWKFWSSTEEDTWEEYSTIGYLVATKNPGDISDGCLNDTAACAGELLDLTSSYKKKEPSGPGNPTSGPIVPQLPTESPASLGDLQKRSIPAVISDLTWLPKKAGPIVAEEGGALNSVTLQVSLENNGTSEETASCYFSAVMTDYTGHVYNDSSNRSYRKELLKNVTLQAGERKMCGEFTYSYEDYIVGFKREGYADPAEEQEYPYAVEFFVSTPGRTRHHQKLFCKPQPNSTSICEGRRGTVPTSASLLEREDYGACADLGTHKTCTGQQQCKWQGRCVATASPRSKRPESAEEEDLDVTAESARPAAVRPRRPRRRNP